jgi:hypothetical protein
MRGTFGVRARLPWHNMLYLLVGIVAYLVYVRLQRYKRVKETLSAYSAAHRETGSEMTPAEAQQIVFKTLSLEGPFLGQKALEFALFRVGAAKSRSSSQRTVQLIVGGLGTDIRHRYNQSITWPHKGVYRSRESWATVSLVVRTYITPCSR